MSAAAALAAGFSTLLAHHGETLSYLPASAVVRRENSEAVSDEGGVAVLKDEYEAVEVTAIFDEAYVLTSPEGAGFVNTAPAVMLLAADVPDCAPGAVFTRGATAYYAMICQEPALDGSQVIILGRQVQ